MTTAIFRFDRLMFRTVERELMFVLPRAFQADESPALIEARMHARRWMEQRQLRRSMSPAVSQSTVNQRSINNMLPDL